MENQRPRLSIDLTPADKLVEAAGWLMLAGIWLLVLISYADLPDRIPTHFNLAGKADGFGKKAAIILLPAIATVLFAGMTVVNRFPHAFNFGVPVTPENARFQYTNATRMMRWIKLGLLILFGFLTVETIGHATGKTDGLGSWFLPVMLLIQFVPMTFFLVKSFRGK